MEILETACGIRHTAVSVSRPEGTTRRPSKLFSLFFMPHSATEFAGSYVLSFPCFPDIPPPIRFTHILSAFKYFPYYHDPTFPLGYFTSFLGQLMHLTPFALYHR